MSKLQFLQGCGWSPLLFTTRPRPQHGGWLPPARMIWAKARGSRALLIIWFPSLLPYSLALGRVSMMCPYWREGTTPDWGYRRQRSCLPPSLSRAHLASLWSEDQGPYLLSWYNSTAGNTFLSWISPSSEGRPPSLNSFLKNSLNHPAVSLPASRPSSTSYCAFLSSFWPQISPG